MIEIKPDEIVPCYMYISDAEDHLPFKKWFAEYISSTMIFGTSDRIGSSIYNTDFFISNFHKEYRDIVFPVINKHTLFLSDLLGYSHLPLQIKNIWFQQYKKGDGHIWHRHDSVFSNVYYVDLPEGSSKTTFRFKGKEFQVEIKEGQILSFPSFLEHCSKPNPSDHIKTVIAFNTN